MMHGLAIVKSKEAKLALFTVLDFVGSEIT
jgi:hypothetical protein